MPDQSAIASNIARVRERVALAAKRAGRSAGEITIVAVSKTFPADAIRVAYEAGLRHFGENRVQEWESKRSAVVQLDATWHLIGHLQSNKTRRAAYVFNRVDSVDDLALAKRLDAAAAAEGKSLPVLIEVRLSDEATKSGVAESDLPTLAASIAPFGHLDLLGLMTIPPFLDDPERVRPYFRKLRALRDQLSHHIGRKLPVLSMGMSHDFEVAIEEGATEIRVGTAIFGERTYQPAAQED
ncbi:MAG TPA: YggS family pyridoxal phosphate-dependent enzyme [Candidatus Acidoferrum sp.]|nr:YggS family pyridoxal phosphate-dependent enzyme [Candidatus Acidoferrum sp.]